MVTTLIFAFIAVFGLLLAFGIGFICGLLL